MIFDKLNSQSREHGHYHHHLTQDLLLYHETCAICDHFCVDFPSKLLFLYTYANKITRRSRLLSYITCRDTQYIDLHVSSIFSFARYLPAFPDVRNTLVYFLLFKDEFHEG